MNEHIKQTVQSIKSQFNAVVEEFRGETSLIVLPEFIVPVMNSLKSNFQFNALMDVTAVDYYPNETPRFHVVYQLYSMPENVRI